MSANERLGISIEITDVTAPGLENKIKDTVESAGARALANLQM